MSSKIFSLKPERFWDEYKFSSDKREEECNMIKIKSMKKVLAAALALSLVMAPAMGVSAKTGSTGSVSTSEGGSTYTPTVTVAKTSSINAGGRYLVTTIKGAYMSAKIPGTVVTTAKETLAAAYNLAPGEAPYVRVYDITAKNSPSAMASIEAVTKALGGTMVAAVNMEFGKTLGGKFSLLPQGGAPISVVFGIPKASIRAGYAYAIVCVRPGGAFEILPDLDTDPNTVTFNTTGGLGAYAIVMYPVA